MAAELAANAPRKESACGTGVAGPHGFRVFGRAEIRESRARGDLWIDGVYVLRPEVTRDGLRRALQAIGSSACLGEHMAFDIVRDALRIVRWRLAFAVVVKVIGPKALQCHMRPPSVVPVVELAAQHRQVIEPLDQRDVFEPFVFAGFDDTLGHSNGPTLAHSAEARLDVPLLQQLSKNISGENTGLVGDDVLGRSVLLHGLFQGLDDPSGVRSFQGCDTYDFAGEVVNGHQDVNGPQAPAADRRGAR